MNIIVLIAMTLAAILFGQIIIVESVKGGGLSRKMGIGMALGGWPSTMGMIASNDDGRLLGVSRFLTQSGFGKPLTDLTTDVCYIALSCALGYLTWLLVKRRFSPTA